MNTSNSYEALTNNYPEYLEDQRLPIKKLYRRQQILTAKFSFSRQLIFQEKLIDPANHSINLPAYSYTSAISGPALWIISGIHGEEPAGPNALATKIKNIGNLAKKIPLVILPLCNPKGYYLGWRYPNQAKYSNLSTGQSVGDSEHYLPDNPANPTKPRENKPSCLQSAALTKHLLKLAKTYPPILSLDLHEDDLLDKGYIYSQGKKGSSDPTAIYIVKLLTSHKIALHLFGQTRFQQTITNGVVASSQDGSIDELLASPKIFFHQKLTAGPQAPSVIVIETSAQNQPLTTRQKAHELILDHLEQLWQIANQ